MDCDSICAFIFNFPFSAAPYGACLKAFCVQTFQLVVLLAPGPATLDATVLFDSFFTEWLMNRMQLHVCRRQRDDREAGFYFWSAGFESVMFPWIVDFRGKKSNDVKAEADALCCAGSHGKNRLNLQLLFKQRPSHKLVLNVIMNNLHRYDWKFIQHVSVTDSLIKLLKKSNLSYVFSCLVW